MMRWVVGSILHGDSIELFLVPGRGICYPVCWMMHIKEPLLLLEKVAHVVAAAGFLFLPSSAVTGNN